MNMTKQNLDLSQEAFMALSRPTERVRHYNAIDENNCVHEIIYDENRGERICIKCGLVLEEHVFDESLDISRFQGSQAAAEFGARKGSLTETGNRIQKNLRRYSCKSYNEKRISRLIKLLKGLCTTLDLNNNIASQAEYILKKAFPILKNIDERIIVSACLELICDRENYPLRKSKIAYYFDYSTEGKNREWNNFMSKVRSLKNAIREQLGITYTPQRPEMFIPELVKHFEVGTKIEMDARKILEVYLKYFGYKGNKHQPIAGAAFILACARNDIRITQKQVAEFLNSTDVTIRNRIKEMQWLLRRPMTRRKDVKKHRKTVRSLI